MKNKVLLKALKGAENKEEMLELIDVFYKEDGQDKTEDKKDDKEGQDDVKKEKVEKTEDKKDDKKNDKVEDKKEDKADIDNKDQNTEVKALIERVKQLEDDKKVQDAKMKEWEDLANVLAKDKPFGVVKKVQKRDENVLYDKYDADLIIGK